MPASIGPKNHLGVSSPFPPGNLSFLHAINAIGNKFALPEAGTIGPSSGPNTAAGVFSGELDFHLGAVPKAETHENARQRR
jgi:hypothetical protein